MAATSVTIVSDHVATGRMALASIDLLSARLKQARASLDMLSLALNSEDTVPTSESVANAVWAVDELLKQAEAAMCQ